MPGKTKLVETPEREQLRLADMRAGVVHDYDSHLAAANEGKIVKCFCVQIPYVKRLPVLKVVNGGLGV